jgi:hypothetical protein
MHYYYEKEAADRLHESARNQRNANFAREWRVLQRDNRRGVFETLVCRLTSWTPLQWCAEPVVGQQAQATASFETNGRSQW